MRKPKPKEALQKELKSQIETGYMNLPPVDQSSDEARAFEKMFGSKFLDLIENIAFARSIRFLRKFDNSLWLKGEIDGKTYKNIFQVHLLTEDQTHYKTGGIYFCKFLTDHKNHYDQMKLVGTTTVDQLIDFICS